MRHIRRQHFIRVIRIFEISDHMKRAIGNLGRGATAEHIFLYGYRIRISHGKFCAIIIGRRYQFAYDIRLHTLTL